MKSNRLIKLWIAAMLIVCSICFTGCASQTKLSLPPMGEKAVPILPLDERPVLDLTDADITAIFKASPTGTSKILKNQTRWAGYADIAEAAVEGYKSYLKGIFGGDKAKKKTP